MSGIFDLIGEVLRGLAGLLLAGCITRGAVGVGMFLLAWVTSMKPHSTPTALEDKTMATGVVLAGIGFVMLIVGFLAGLFAG